MFAISSMVRVCIASCLVTIFVVLCTAVHLQINYSDALREQVQVKAIGAAVVLTFPTCFFVFRQMLSNWRLSQELIRLVNRDRLTDVATRDFFFERLERDTDSYGVSLMVDIDHFKQVNDTFGHYVGDDVIKMVSGILRRETRAQDIVCRFGGEEFVVFLNEVDRDQGLLVAERMRMAIEQQVTESHGFEVTVTVSIGGALKEHLEDINLSIRQADAALYRAKQSGRNRTVVDWMPGALSESAKRAS